MSRFTVDLKRLVIGRPLASFAEPHERLGCTTGLAVLASDAISSTAYAGEEILLVLTPVAGLAALGDLVPIALVVVAMLTIVVASYRQTITAYPSGGGSYIVSRRNLGTTPSLVAGASLLVDYILTVAVSVSAGVAAITSAYRPLQPHRVAICLMFIAVIALANLRGIRESGRLFSAPTLIYIAMLAGLITVGLLRTFVGGLAPLPTNTAALDAVTNNGATLGAVTPLLLLRAFSSGAVALTGVEAISNGVPAFRKPESRNAAITLTWMGAILGAGFFGTALLAHRLHPTVSPNETLLSIMGAAVFGRGTAMYYGLQFATFAVLVLAANTAFADFPRLSSIIARDGYLPRPFANRGDRLVFSTGILVLAAVAGALIVAFRGDTSALIPLYAVGVFVGFTLSQAGMVRHHQRVREPHWRRNSLINGAGATATGVVLVVVLVSKFAIGAWIPAALIPVIVLLFRTIGTHYDRVARDLHAPAQYVPPLRRNTVVVLVGQVHRGTIDALAYARSLQPARLHAITVAIDPHTAEATRDEWDDRRLGIPLEVLPSPYRDLTEPVIGYLDRLDALFDDDIITVVIPDYVVAHGWDLLLHNKSALALLARLRRRDNTVVVMVPIRRTVRPLRVRRTAADRRRVHDGHTHPRRRVGGADTTTADSRRSRRSDRPAPR